ncbi:Protein CBG04728 [Caenorhabditis briggsae]|uniref:Protein CBG04728 n=1 Tax=Caenorhabditis briggsae TaxID=6238 RepID=A8WYB8_CAEBR|nr:Protein CBG04728 [Caenorhabditis briggsae]CAP25376.2 Protein CBG04728 [Caenorhabditis briggsae]
MDDLKEGNRVDNVTEIHWIESSTEKSIIFSATAVGALVELIPSVPLLNHLRVRRTLSLFGLCSTLGTFFTPIAVSLSFYLVVWCRFLQGLGVSVILTVLGLIPSSWSPKSDHSTYLAILSSAWQFANAIFMPVSGVLCDSSFGWRSIYYLFGGLTGIFYSIFYIFYTDAPSMHRNVSEKELGTIGEGKQEQPTIYTLWLFTSVLGLIIGYAIMIWTTNRIVAFCAFGFAGITSGLIIIATVKCLTLRCQQHCHFAVGATSFMSYCVQFILPLCVGFMCPDNTSEQWTRLFVIVTVVVILTNIPFPLLTIQEPADYTKQSDSSDRKI